MFNTFVQFLKEFNETWRKLLDEIIWEFQYQIKFVLDDKKQEPQQKMVGAYVHIIINTYNCVHVCTCKCMCIENIIFLVNTFVQFFEEFNPFPAFAII